MIYSQTAHLAKILKKNCPFWHYWPHKTTLELNLSCFPCKRMSVLNTFWHGCLTVLNNPDLQCIMLCFLLKIYFGRCKRSENNMERRYSVSQSEVSQSVSHSANQSFSQSISQSFSQSLRHSVSFSVIQSVIQSVSGSSSQSVSF